MQRDQKVRHGDQISTSESGPWKQIAVASSATVRPASKSTPVSQDINALDDAEIACGFGELNDVEPPGKKTSAIPAKGEAPVEETVTARFEGAAEEVRTPNETTVEASEQKGSRPTPPVRSELETKPHEGDVIGQLTAQPHAHSVSDQSSGNNRCISCQVIFSTDRLDDVCPVCRARAQLRQRNSPAASSSAGLCHLDDESGSSAGLRLPPPLLPNHSRSAPMRRSKARQIVWAVSGAGLLFALILIWATGSLWSNPDLVAPVAATSEPGHLRDPADASDASKPSPSRNSGTVLPRAVVDVTRRVGLNQAERDRLEREIQRIEQSLQNSEILSKTVYQQQVARTEACIEITGLVARSLGANANQLEQIDTRRKSRELLSETVFQQLAVHLSAYVETLALTCRTAGAGESVIAAIEQSLTVDDSLSRTVQHQIAARLDTALKLSEILSKSLGADAVELATLRATISTRDALSDTVFQQMSARQAGIAHMLGAAAQAAGASPTTIDQIEREMELDDIRSDTVQQQLAARMQRALDMSTALAKAIVMK